METDNQNVRQRQPLSSSSDLRGKEEATEIVKPEKIELLYDGMYYDVTSWIEKHPGGNIINFYTNKGNGEDATLAIQQFHYRVLKKVLLILKSFPHRLPNETDKCSLSSETIERHQKLTEGFQKLSAEVIAEGLMEPNPPRFAKRIGQALVMFLIGLVLSFTIARVSLLWRVISVLVMTLASGQALWLGHEVGHNAFTGNRKYDRIVQILLYGFVFGLSGSSWNSTHADHHALPQHEAHDADLNTLPILAFNKRLVKTPTLAKSFWLRNQKWLFVLCDTCIVTLTWKFNHHIKFCIKNKKWFDLLCMACHYSLIPLVGFVDWMLITWLGSIYVLGTLILSHTHLPVVEDGQQLHWVEYALHNTTNMRSSWWVDWWTGHLNYQIEHHLFPTMPEYKNKLCSAKVRAFAKEHDLPYHLCSYWEAMKTTYSNLDKVSQEIRHTM